MLLSDIFALRIWDRQSDGRSARIGCHKICKMWAILDISCVQSEEIARRKPSTESVDMSVYNFVRFLIFCYNLIGLSVCLKNRRNYNQLVLNDFIIYNCNVLKTMAFLFTFYCRLSGRCITLLFSFLSCGCPKHSLTWSANKNDPTFSIVFYSAAAAPGFCHNIIKFRFPPKFLNKGCDWYQWGVTAFAFKADMVVCDGCQSCHAPIMFWQESEQQLRFLSFQCH